MKIFLIAIAALAGTSGAAVAGGPPFMGGFMPSSVADEAPSYEGRALARRTPSPDRMFDRMDANHDGSISRTEFASAHGRMIERRRERRGDSASRR